MLDHDWLWKGYCIDWKLFLPLKLMKTWSRNCPSVKQFSDLWTRALFFPFCGSPGRKWWFIIGTEGIRVHDCSFHAAFSCGGDPGALQFPWFTEAVIGPTLSSIALKGSSTLMGLRSDAKEESCSKCFMGPCPIMKSKENQMMPHDKQFCNWVWKSKHVNGSCCFDFH